MKYVLLVFLSAGLFCKCSNKSNNSRQAINTHISDTSSVQYRMYLQDTFLMQETEISLRQNIYQDCCGQDSGRWYYEVPRNFNRIVKGHAILVLIYTCTSCEPVISPIQNFHENDEWKEYICEVKTGTAEENE